MLLPWKLTFHRPLRLSALWSLQRQQVQYLAARAPCCFISDTCFPLNLPGRDVALSREQQVQNIEPSSQRRRALREDCSRQRVNVIATMIAGVSFSARHAVMSARDAALLAVDHTLGPELLLDVFQTDVIAGKVPKEIR